MNKIHLLDNNLINKIAAGEVIERPASVIKELVENSIDAGATVIMIAIKDGGTSLITVMDNGCGIPKEDVKQAFLRHATSKLNNFDDLYDISTLGFRGEALASIASVSQPEMSTKTQGSKTGTLIKINGGAVEEIKDTSTAEGTVIHVKNLFYNTPARKKFLKRNSTEGSYVADVVNKIALGHPEIAFKLMNNNIIIMQTNGRGDLKTTAYGILGRDTARALLPVKAEKDGWKISGFIAKPEVSRGNRSFEYFYLNGRYIKSEILIKAAEEGYKGLLMNGRFPVFILSLTHPPGAVDVNVHPAKLEVRFNNDNFMFDFVSSAIAKKFKKEVLIPGGEEPEEQKTFSEITGIKAVSAEEITIDLDEVLKEIDDKEYAEEKAKIKAEKPKFRVKPLEEAPAYDDTPAEPMKMTLNEPKKEKIDITPLKDIVMGIRAKEEKAKAAKEAEELEKKEVETVKEKPETAADKPEKNSAEKTAEPEKKPELPKMPVYPPRKPFFHNYKIIGQIFFTYWLVEQGNELYFIDQHAAHEKILYERLSKAIGEGTASSQLLLEPVTVTVNLREKKVIEENAELFKSIGFEVEPFGRNTYAIRAVPFIFDGTANPVFFMDIVDSLSDGSIRDGFDLKQDKIAEMSCKAAVKGNNVLNYAEAKALIEDLLKLENPFNCPHGRPTIIKVSKYEIEKKFKRII
ncbi:MAG: DNA mismatch repair endonuclease MutL [Clostridiales bacterium]|nr:DNA mismatch repair endonuclease MutL [Clostridiales bacterium]